jgi:hypothetical protein
MEELTSLTWLLEHTKRQFQAFGVVQPFNEGKRQKQCRNKKRTLPANIYKGKRPRESLAVLIYQAMCHYRRKLTVAEIADYIADKYSYYKVRKQWTVSNFE